MSLDYLRVSEDKKLLKQFQPNEKVVLSTKLTKINYVNKKQERILVLTTHSLYNILPEESFLGLFSRIKRRITYDNIIAMTVSRLGSEFVVHVGKDHDYRYSSTNIKLKIVECLIDCYCKFHNKKMALYYCDQLELQSFTTTINDVEKNIKKTHNIQPLYLDAETLKQSEQTKAESKLIFKNESNKEEISNIQQFQLLKVLGRGAFGKVMLCRNERNKRLYAVKSMRKQSLIEKQHLQKIKTQRYLLQKAKHPFLVSLQFAFQTKEKIFFVMDFLRGGQMFTHLRKAKRFPQARTQFYAAQVFLALNYLHQLGFVYRDLKPQNILFDVDGYIKVSDYGLAKKLLPGQKTYTLAGTPDYVSPEVVSGKGQSFATDWWSYGILLFQMMYGVPPFYDRDHSKMFKDIINRDLYFDNTKTGVSEQCKDLIYTLLRKDPTKRLGSNDQNQIKSHPFFAGMNWEALSGKKIKPQFIPVLGNQMDVGYFDEACTREQPINSLVQSDILLLNKFEKQFQGLDFNRETNQMFKKKK